MKLRHMYSKYRTGTEATTEILVSGCNVNHIEDRIARLETILARVIDHIGLTDDEKRVMFQDLLGDWEFVEDKNDRS